MVMVPTATVTPKNRGLKVRSLTVLLTTARDRSLMLLLGLSTTDPRLLDHLDVMVLVLVLARLRHPVLHHHLLLVIPVPGTITMEVSRLLPPDQERMVVRRIPLLLLVLAVCAANRDIKLTSVRVTTLAPVALPLTEENVTTPSAALMVR